MPIGGGKRTGGIGKAARKGWIGRTGTATGDSLSPGASESKSRSQYPTTTSTFSTTSTASTASTTSTASTVSTVTT